MKKNTLYKSYLTITGFSEPATKPIFIYILSIDILFKDYLYYKSYLTITGFSEPATNPKPSSIFSFSFLVSVLVLVIDH